MIKAALTNLLFLLALTGFGQDDCISLYCDDHTWLENQIESINDEIAQAPALGIGICNSGTIRMCFYQNAPVYTYLQSIYICDLPTRVVDCEGNFIFSYGGFCPPPGCPGDQEAALLQDCVTLYTTTMTDAEFCTPAGPGTITGGGAGTTSIPTMGQWGLICLVLSLCIAGVNSIRPYERTMA